MPLREILELLAGPDAILRYAEGSGADLVTRHGHVTNEDLIHLIDDGWIYSMNGTYRLTDAGRVAYFRSTDELGDGKLVAPASVSQKRVQIWDAPARIEAGTDETRNAAQPVGREPDKLQRTNP